MADSLHSHLIAHIKQTDKTESTTYNHLALHASAVAFLHKLLQFSSQNVKAG